MQPHEIQNLKELLIIHRERLHQLEVKKATYGIDTEPQVNIEIEEIRRSISYIESALQGTATEATIHILGETGRFLALQHDIKTVDQRYRHQLQYLAEKLSAKIDKIEELQQFQIKVTYRWLTALSIATTIMAIIIIIELSLHF